MSALSPHVGMPRPNPQGYKPGPFSLSSTSSPPSSVPPPKATALTSGCSPSWWRCQGHSDEFQAGRSTSWRARTRPRGPTAVLGGSYNQPHSCPAPHSLLAPHSFNHTLGHTPGTPGPQDTGQLGTETHAGQGHNCCCSACPSGIPKQGKPSNLPRSEGLLGTFPGCKAVGALGAIARRGWDGGAWGWGWLADRLTAERAGPPVRPGTLLGTATSKGSEHRAQAVLARSTAAHSCQAAQVERLPVHQPLAFLRGERRKKLGWLPLHTLPCSLGSPLPPPGPRQGAGSSQ